MLADKTESLRRSSLSLDGLSIGDAFGEAFFGVEGMAERRIVERSLSPAPWRYTDDTEMALGIVDVLRSRGTIDQDDLVDAFVTRYVKNPARGYGRGARTILEQIRDGMPWRTAAARAFDGQGSMGNGGAMRVAPLGAWFAGDMGAVVRHARASAEVTHAHPEGQAGAVAIAVAAAWACTRNPKHGADRLFETVLDATPHGQTRDGISRAVHVPHSDPPRKAAAILGNGSRVTSPDTVPFTIWCAARHLDNYVEAMWSTVSALGDRDTNCAIVGGIVALSAPGTVPEAWRDSREPLK